MNATVPGALRAASPVYADPAAAYIAANEFDRPTLVFSRDRIAAQYDALHAGLGRAHIHYAVKANPAAQVIRTLVAKGSGFDCASRGEIELCLSQGAKPDHISFGNIETLFLPVTKAFCRNLPGGIFIPQKRFFGNFVFGKGPLNLEKT